MNSRFCRNPAHRAHWRHIPPVHTAVRALYRLGLVTAYSTSYTWDCAGYLHTVRFAGRRGYILGVRRSQLARIGQL